MEELVKIDADKKADIENKLKVAQTELDAFNKELEKRCTDTRLGMPWSFWLSL
jgi:ABC-type Zn uptake system ZnuABC Zn-binding protein ZnuA